MKKLTRHALTFLLTLTTFSLAPLSQERNINLALDGAAVVSASSTANANFPAAAANDGDRKGLKWGMGGGWNDGTPNTFPDWHQTTFARPMVVSRVVAVSLQNNFTSPAEPAPTMACTFYQLKDFEVQYFDGSTWVTPAGGAVVGNTLCVREVTFAPVRAAQWRIYVTATGDGVYSRLIEGEYYPL